MPLKRKALFQLSFVTSLLVVPIQSFGQATLFELIGSGSVDALGLSTAGVGDVNNDGHPDFAAYDYRVRVFSGVNGTEIFTSADYADTRIAGIGDINGDGINDLAYSHYDFASGTPPPYLTVRAGSTFSVIFQIGGFFAESIESVGDLNGDGVSDIIIAAGGYQSTHPRVISGVNGATIHIFTNYSGPNKPRAAIGIGDVNGDAIPDLAIASVTANSVDFYSGANFSLIQTATPGTGVGLSLDRIGDLNGDSISDILLGGGGHVYVLSGSDGSIVYHFTIPLSSSYGDSVASLGDANRDGVDDFAISASCDGLVEVRSGIDGKILYVVNQQSGSSSCSFGYSIAGIGDINLDGVGELLIGDPYYGSLQGRIEVISGCQGFVSTYGQACQSSTGLLPSLHISGCPSPGGRLYLNVTNGTPNTSGSIKVGRQPASIPLGGQCTQYINNPVRQVPITLDAFGNATVTIKPMTPFHGYFQGFIGDNGLPWGSFVTEATDVDFY